MKGMGNTRHIPYCAGGCLTTALATREQSLSFPAETNLLEATGWQT